MSCKGKLANSSCKPFNLSKHQKPCSKDEIAKPKSYFKKKLKIIEDAGIKGKLTLTNYPIMQKKCSIFIAKHNAVSKKPYTDPENYVKPIPEYVTQTFVPNDKVLQKITDIPLSDSTMKRRTDELVLDIKEQLSVRITNSLF